MYVTSNEYKNVNMQHDRKFESKITIGNRVITNEEVVSIDLQQSIQQDVTFTLGNAISSALNLSFLHNDIEISDREIINVELGLLVNNNYEYIPLGIYNIDSYSSNDTTTTIVAYDNMVKFDIPYTENSFNPTVYNVINRLVELTGIEFGEPLSNYVDHDLITLNNYTCREVLGFVAGVLGCNAIIDRQGKFKFVDISKTSSLTITTEDYYDYSRQSKLYKISKLTNTLNNSLIEVGETTDDTVCLNFANPLINKSMLQNLYNKINGLEFLPYQLNWNGDLSLDLGDLIEVVDNKGRSYIQPILSQSFTYTGGLSSIVQAQGDTKLANAYDTKTKEEADIDRVQGNLDDTIVEVNEVKVTVNKLHESIELKVERKEVEILEENLSAVQQDVASVKEGMASLNIDLEGITQTVKSTEETIGKIDGNLASLENRVNTAEQKITSDAIVSTVTSSSDYKNDMDGKVDSTHIISTINQTAEAIKIDASRIELTGDVICNAVNSDSTTTINGEKITTGTITADQISAGAITAEKITLSPAANNLLKNGAFLYSTTANPPKFWDAWGLCSRSFNTITGKRWLNIYKSDKESFRGISQITDEGSYSTNTRYTISLLAMPYSSSYYNRGVKIGVHLLDSSNNILEQYWNVESECSVGNSTTTPNLVTFTFTTGSNTQGVKFNVMIGGCEGAYFDYRITDISMVKGDYAMQWTPHISEVYSQKVNITDNGMVIRNNAGSTVMSADDLGNLTLAGNITSGATITGGTLKSTNGDMYFNMDSGYMLLYNGGTRVGQTQKNSIAGTSIYGVSNGAEYGSYSCLSAKTSSSASTYTMMVTAAGTDLSSAIQKGVSFGHHTYFNNWNIDNPNFINNPTAIKWDNTNGQEARIYGSSDNNLILRCSDTDTNMVTITCNHDTAGHRRIADFSYNNSDGTGIHFWRKLDMHKWGITNAGAVTASVIEADDIEMPAPFAMFNEDGEQVKYTATKSLIANTEYFGSGEIINGECVIDLPVGILIGEKGYMVTLTPIGKKEIWLESKDYESFTVKGEDCVFDYLIKAHSPSIAMYKSDTGEEAPTEDVSKDVVEGTEILLES